LITPIIAGFSAGSVHVLAGPDHLAAVAPLAAERQTGSWRTGLLWGLGHAGGVLVVGVAALLAREILPLDELSGWSERLVGLVLVGIGLWGIGRARRQHVHGHEHTHDGHKHAHIHVHPEASDHDAPHAHAPSEAHQHVQTRAAFGVGVLHGLAGSAHFLGVLPALAFPSRADAIVYVVLFGAGTVSAMTLFAALIGWVAGRFAGRGTHLYRALLYSFSVAAIVVGLVWLVA
jgi:ABC-type nickel/cobalt efflux system permease component RcnA